MFMIQDEQKEQSKVPVDPITPSSSPTPTPPPPSQPAYTRAPKVSITVLSKLFRRNYLCIVLILVKF
jgi:hypothetical protein